MTFVIVFVVVVAIVIMVKNMSTVYSDVNASRALLTFAQNIQPVQQA
jgi:hypothetical protein